MRSLSVRFKILFAFISMSAFGLMAFGWLTFQSYKKDKLAFVYDNFLTETQSKSDYFSSSVESYDGLLNIIISGIDFNSSQLSENVLKSLKKSPKIRSIHYHIPDRPKLSHITVLGPEVGPGPDWPVFEAAPKGISIKDSEKGEFIYKKALSRPGSWAVLVFEQKDLIDLMYRKKDRFSFFLQGKKVLSKAATPLSGTDMAQVMESIERMQTPFGLYESTLRDEEFIVAFSKLSLKDMVFVNLIAKKKVMLIQEIFSHQIVLFLGLMISISLIVGTLAAGWLTRHLDGLTLAVREMENENFDYKVEVKSGDELGILGMAFNSMTGKISDLLRELRKYNTELEAMVAKRTEELQELTNIQKAMLNSLGQGFVIIDKDHKISPVYSKIAVDMFEVKPDEVPPNEVMAISQEESGTFKELFDLAFAGMMDFDDFSKLIPEFRTNEKQQKIFLNYSPINGNDGKLEYVLVIGTDKTAELESLEKSKREWNFAQMISRMARSRYSLAKIITETDAMLEHCLKLTRQSSGYPVRELQRNIHTIKGSFSYFFIEDITTAAHNLESFLGQYFDSEGCPEEARDEIRERIQGIQGAIESFIDKYDDIIQYRDAKEQKLIPLETINGFGQLLKTKSKDLFGTYQESFYKVKVSPYFQMYPTVIEELSLKLGKKAQFVLEGGELELPENNWEEIFQQFIHVVRNAMDHGLEAPEERTAAGKPETGTIRFAFEKDEHYLTVSLSDDGRGIDWEKIAAKDPHVKSEADAIKRILLGGVSSKDTVSDVSGRGVGVSSVFDTVSKRGGHFEISNVKGQGMKITLILGLHPGERGQNLKLIA